MDILSQSALVVAITAVAWGLSVLARDVRNKLYLGYALLCVAISAWAFFFFLSRLMPNHGWYAFHLLANLWLTPLALGFIRSLTRLQDRPGRILFELSWISALVLSALLLFPGKDPSWLKTLVLFHPVLVVAQILLMMAVDFRLDRRPGYRPAKAPAVGLGRRYLIYLGALAVLGTCVMDHVPWAGAAVPVIGNFALIVYLYFLSRAITQQRLLNFGAVLSRFLVLLFISLLLTGIYSLLLATIADKPALFLLNSFIISFLVVVMLDPLRSGVRWLTERLLTQKHRRLTAQVQVAQRRLSGVLSLSALFRELAAMLDRVLPVTGVGLFLLSADGTRFRRRMAKGLPPADDEGVTEILSGHGLISYSLERMRRGRLPVVLGPVLEAEIERSASKAQRERLSELLSALRGLGGNLFIPLAEEEKLLGFVVLQAPEPPSAWAGNWGFLEELYPYFQALARTLGTLEVYVQAREKDRLAALGEMAAGLAHEIRNPLGAIQGAAQLLGSDPAKPDSRFSQVIVEEVRRLDRVVSQFLDFSKPRNPELKPVELNELARAVVERMKAGLRPDLDFGFRESGSPAWVLASAEPLMQVLMNLVQNAARATLEKASPQVQVRVESQRFGHPMQHALVVEDNGRGIPESDRDRLFIPFFTTDPQGTGLGLPICQRIVESQNGRIEVKSRVGEFSRFSVILPEAGAELGQDERKGGFSG